jgi:hypothetical protein
MVGQDDRDALNRELENNVPKDLQRHLYERDGAASLVAKLPAKYSPEEVAVASSQQRAWEILGLFYFNQLPKRRSFEALQIFLALYQHILEAQSRTGNRFHKGMALLWAAECFEASGYPSLRRRYLMLALCEDAITGEGTVSPTSGVYFRLVWRLGLGDAELKAFASESYRVSQSSSPFAHYPEWVLQNMGQSWRTEVPSPDEANIYVPNIHYLNCLLGQVGDKSGVVLETLAEYMMLCMPGCRTSRRRRSFSTDYDIVCSMEGFSVDFRSELGRYFVCECKDWNRPADFTTMAKFCRVLDSVKSKFGILFSSHGISGTGRGRDAERELLKVFQDRGIVIVVVDRPDLEQVANGANFVNMLRSKYERIRLDLSEV